MAHDADGADSETSVGALRLIIAEQKTRITMLVRIQHVLLERPSAEANTG